MIVTGRDACVERTRGGFSLLELVIAFMIGVTLFGIIMSMFTSTRKMSSASDLAGSLQDAALAMAVIEEDLIQSVEKPDRSSRGAVLVGPRHFQLLRSRLRSDGSVEGVLVVYRAGNAGGGHFQLTREEAGKKTPLPGLFRRAAFEDLDGPGGPYVRVTLEVASRDGKSSSTRASDGAVVTSLVRVMGPSLGGSSQLHAGFLKSLMDVPYLNLDTSR